MIEEHGEEKRHPLLSQLYKMFVADYHVEFCSPVKLKMKVQIDSLSCNSTPKDDLIELMLHDYRQNGINAYLIAPEKIPPTIIGSSVFTVVSAKKLMPILEKIANAIRQCILADVSSHPRIQMIVRQQEHYCVVDFEKSSGRCFVLDAAGDARQYNLIDVLKSLSVVTSIVYVNNFTYEHAGAMKTTTLQKDFYSCALFALDHVQVCASQDDLHQILATKANDEDPKISTITWFDLPAPFVRNAQSPTFKIKYFETTHDESAKSYFELHDFKKTMNHFKLNGVRLLKNINENLCSEITQEQGNPSISMSI